MNTEILFKQYYRPLCHYAWKMVSDMELAKDIVQDVFVTYYRQEENISAEENAVRSFLYSSVRFACFNVARQKNIINRYWERTGFEESMETQIENDIIRSEVISEIMAIIEKMPSSCGLIFRKGYLEGLSNLEIAKELDISVNTVKTQKQRGLKILKAKLNPEFMAIFLLLLKC